MARSETENFGGRLRPNLAMGKVQRGEAPGGLWFEKPKSLVDKSKKGRHVARPFNDNSRRSCFPASEINLFAGSGKSTATEFYNTDPFNHPEYTAHKYDFNRKRDRVVKYRESMLRVKSMMTGAGARV